MHRLLVLLWIIVLTSSGAWGQGDLTKLKTDLDWELAIKEAARNETYKNLSFEFDYLIGRTAINMNSRVHFEFSKGRFLSKTLLQGDTVLTKVGTNLLTQPKRAGQGDEVDGFDGTTYYSYDPFQSTIKLSTDANKLFRHMVVTLQRNPIINPWFQITNFKDARVFPKEEAGILDFSSAFTDPKLKYKFEPLNLHNATFKVYRVSKDGEKLVSEGLIDLKTLLPVAFKSDFGNGRGLQWSVSELLEFKSGSQSVYIPKEIKYEELLRPEEGKSLSAYVCRFLPETFRFTDYKEPNHFKVPTSLAKTIDDYDLGVTIHAK